MVLYFLSFDRLARHEFEQHRQKWVDRGKLAGFMWTPTEASAMNRFFRRADLTAKEWANDKPEWVWEDIVATDLYNSFRRWRMVFQVGTAVFFALVLASIALSLIIS